MDKRFEVKFTRHIGIFAEEAKELKILNRTTKIDVQNGEMTFEADTKRGVLKSMKFVCGAGVDSPRVRRKCRTSSTDRELR